MNFCFENNTVSGCTELCRMSQSVRTGGETVVPDTGDDIARIASVQSRIVLKSKEATADGMSVTGEVTACCVCITENGGISDIRVSKGFELCFETPEHIEEVQTHILLSQPTAQARLVNPRKVSVVFELGGTLKVYGECVTAVDCLIPAEAADKGLHLKYEQAELTAVTCAAEKTFTVSEQYVFPAGKPLPVALMWEKCDFHVNDVQMIGAKAIIRGNIGVSAYCRTDESVYPALYEFSSPFSQIIDTGTENTEFAAAHIETTALYAELTDTVSGEKALNLELHALAEISGCCKRTVRYVSDLYSNLAEARCVYEKRVNIGYTPVRICKYNSGETVTAGDDCEEIVCVLTSVSQPLVSGSLVTAKEMVDIIYKDLHGELACTSRTVNIEGNLSEENALVLSSVLTDVYVRTDGSRAEVHSALEISYQSAAQSEIKAAAAVELEDELPYDFSAFPTVTLVRADSDDLWSFAKTYHSDISEITALNEIEGSIKGKLLLIPKSV